MELTIFVYSDGRPPVQRRAVSHYVYSDGRPPDGNPIMRHSYHTSRRKTGNMKYSMIYFQNHRDILQAFRPNPDPAIYTTCDHIDGNPENQQLCNLRWATQQMNMLNLRRAKGWQQKGDRYYAYIKIASQWYHLGVYNTPEEAHDRYDHYRDLAFRYVEAYWERHVANALPAPVTTVLLFNPLKINEDTLVIAI